VSRRPADATFAARAARVARFAVGVLALLVALGPFSRFYAKLLAGESSHVCHCEIEGGHAACACPICFPELRSPDDAEVVTVKGACGDPTPLFRGAVQPAFLPSPLVLSPSPADAAVRLPRDARLRPRLHDAPDPPPPRRPS